MGALACYLQIVYGSVAPGSGRELLGLRLGRLVLLYILGRRHVSQGCVRLFSRSARRAAHLVRRQPARQDHRVRNRVNAAVQHIALASARRKHGRNRANKCVFMLHVGKAPDNWLLDTGHVELWEFKTMTAP